MADAREDRVGDASDEEGTAVSVCLSGAGHAQCGRRIRACTFVFIIFLVGLIRAAANYFFPNDVPWLTIFNFLISWVMAKGVSIA